MSPGQASKDTFAHTIREGEARGLLQGLQPHLRPPEEFCTERGQAS